MSPDCFKHQKKQFTLEPRKAPAVTRFFRSPSSGHNFQQKRGIQGTPLSNPFCCKELYAMDRQNVFMVIAKTSMMPTQAEEIKLTLTGA